jgi:hypothetical protein
MFDLSAGKTSSERMAAWLPPLAGLAAAACFAWITCPKPAAESLSWTGVATLGTGYVLLSVLIGVAIMWASTRLLAQGSNASFPGHILTAMVWLPPLALFVSKKSYWATLASAVVGWNLVRSKKPPRDAGVRSVPSLEAVAAAACVIGGVLTAILGFPIASAACFGIGSGCWAWSAGKQKAPLDTPPAGQRETARRALVPLAIALTLTLAGLMQYLQAGNGGEVAGPGRSGTEPLQNYEKDVPGLMGGTYKGVILLPEPVPHKVLAPPVASLTQASSSRKRSEPFSVPFFGVYWMFRWPQVEPPPNSYVVRGSPLKSVFRSSDRFPLSEEARQNFGTPIDLDCCSKIQLAITTADLHSRFITLELIVGDTASPGKPRLSLGQGAIIQTADWRPDNLPVEALMSFDVPRNSALRKFDEATIRFHPRYPFATASTKVSIERFVFLPRGF